MSATTNPEPTRFPDLNAVLTDLVARARAILGDNFVGAYLQGSFALGDADIWSDCDFLIPVRDAITAPQEAALRAMHDEIPTRADHWSRHLEGSYPLRDELRSLRSLGREWLYIDHGAREMEWSTHCNSEVARWSLRERGVTIVGPEPASLVDPVAPDALRARMRSAAATLHADLLTWADFDVAWSQRYAVATACRLLYTYHIGEVASKKAAMDWTAAREPQWADLIRPALADRPRGIDRADRPRPGSVERTVAFLDHVDRAINRRP